VLRAVALLGILVMNIPSFAFPGATYFNPNYSGTFWGADRVVWMISHLLFEQKMMAIFSMLFGAGVLLMTSRAEKNGAAPFPLHMRRMGWLFLIGMVHAYVIWEGDILVGYALCGLIVYPMRTFSAKTLAITGALVLALAVPLSTLQGVGFSQMNTRVNMLVVQQAEGGVLTEDEQREIKAFDELNAIFEPNNEGLREEELSFRGSFADRLPVRAGIAVWLQTYGFVGWTLWRATGLMLVGMALIKSGFLSGACSKKRYARAALFGYGLGLPVVAIGMVATEASRFEMTTRFLYLDAFNYLGSVPVALAHCAVVMLLLMSSARRWIARALSPYGRMALTNYLGQSVICSLVFYGYGFGMWGQFSRVGLMGVVLAVWTVQIIFSHAWLSVFRFGPAEWAWRALVYWHAPKMRRG
jgi:uncharacterized protein